MSDKPAFLADYVDVKERIRLFYERYPDGRLVTARVFIAKDQDGITRVWAKARAYRTPDDPLPGIGWSWLIVPGSSSYTRGAELENAETSAWGRAIGALGIGIERSIASADEVQKNAAGESGAKPKPVMPAHVQPLVGTLAVGKASPVDLELRMTPDGPIVGFVLENGNSKLQVVATDELADVLSAFLPGLVGHRVQVFTDRIDMIDWQKDGKPMRPYKQAHLARIVTDEFTLPALP